MTLRFLRSLLPVACFAILCTGCLSSATAPQRSMAQDRTMSGTVRLASDGKVTVDNHEGRITISTWDREEVRYEAVVRPEPDAEHPEATTVRVDRSDEHFAIETRYDESKGSSDGLFGWGDGQNIMPVEYALTVPRTAEVEIDDHDSDIEIRGLTGSLEIDNHDGPVQIAEHGGDLTIDTHDSDITLRGVAGRLEIDSHDSEIDADGLRGGFALDTHDATGRVAFDAYTDDIEVDSHDAEITFLLPADAGFDLETRFHDADLRADFDLTPFIRDPDDDEPDYEGRVRGGGPRLTLNSHGGDFEIRSR